ncbi:MAG: PD-(D/E)XK nuclease family protein [Gammaproteobacteria bacterium]|nr:PD-(D/E)XK nuclease family protein [Gammaproteobacteria bacterium]
MYEWLTDALQGPSTVITANRRLARALRDEYAHQQVRAGKLAWESPAIHSWQDWLDKLLLGARDQASLPTRINPHQSQLLWERCLSREIGESRSGLAALVRLSRDAWQSLADWRVTIGEVARSAHSIDQRMFAAAAGRYLGILEREHWVDDAGLASLIDELIRSGRASSAGRVTFAGFERERPVVTSIMAALAESGCDVRPAPLRKSADSVGLQCLETADAEMRAAGAWAREQREKNPDCSIAIIAGNLEKEAIHKTHLVREGLVPGWQYGPPSIAHSVNVSYGRKLADFPAVSIALLLLRWLVRDLSAGEIGQLLRTRLLGSPSTGTRSRLELRLRRLPDRNWSPAMLSGALRGREDDIDAADWLRLVATVAKLRRELQRSSSPADWAVYIDSVLKACEWPGDGTLSSSDFQLVNRWRDLLNDLARLALVSPVMTLKAAIRRLELMAADTVFQPQSEGSAVQLIGPLEASGAQFDAVWISGLTAANWPPPGNPSPLLSRRLQRKKGMPDAEPSDTVGYAQSLLLSLGRAASLVVCSYAQTEDDAEQKPSELLQALAVVPQAAQSDPGWHAATLSTVLDTVVASDSVPKIGPGETVSGGAGTLQRQLADPIAAFIVGRLGVKNLQPQAVGLPAPLRGSIIHDALYQLYIDTPSHSDISAWPDHEMAARIERALDFAFARHERNTDAVLKELFRLERRRIAELLQNFVSVDLARGDFTIAEVEHVVAFAEADVRLELRVDRIDRMLDGTLAVLDYKTGAKRRFLQSDGQPKEIQLIAYACALDEPVSALALVNIDSREISFDGAGEGYTDSAEWSDAIAEWKRNVIVACEDLSRGDVRINRAQGIKDARSFNLLSRYTELRRDG